jgi:hypothetical protein
LVVSNKENRFYCDNSRGTSGLICASEHVVPDERAKSTKEQKVFEVQQVLAVQKIFAVQKISEAQVAQKKLN